MSVWIMAALALMAAGHGSYGDAVNWDTDNGNWGDNSSWDLGVPDADFDDVAVIGNGGTANVPSAVKNPLRVVIGNGNVVVGQGGSLTVNRSTSLGLLGHLSLSGNGKFTTESLSNGGLVDLVGTDASLSITQNFTQQGLGKLSVDLSSGSSAVLKVTGQAKLGGTLSAHLPSGADLSFGNSWDFMKAGSFTGSFSQVELPDSFPALDQGLQMQVRTSGGTATLIVGNVPVLNVDRASGAVSIKNIAGGPLDLKAYSIASPSGLLGTAQWNSLNGQGDAGWTVANPRAQLASELNLEGVKTLQINDSISLGNLYTGAVPPSAEDLSLLVSTSDGRVVKGIVEYSGPANDLVLRVDPSTGEAVIRNLSNRISPLDVNGYSILSESGSLVTGAWSSLAASGAAGWGEANPQTTALGELNLEGSMLFDTGKVVSLGSPFKVGGSTDLIFEYSTTADEVDTHFGTVEYGPVGMSMSGADCNQDQIVNILDANCTAAGDLAAFLSANNYLLGDADGDRDVQFSDFVILANHFGNPGQYTDGDFDKDGTVQFSDFVILANHFGQSSAAASAVPEPATGSLLLVAVAFAALATRRARAATVAGVAGGVALATLLSVAQTSSAIDFDTHFMRIDPNGLNNSIDTATEARGILNGTVTDVVVIEDVTGTTDILDFAGGGGNFTVNNPYTNDATGEGQNHFLQQATAVLQIPAGDWTIGFGSDDGGYLRMPGVSFLNTYNESGSKLVAGDGEIFFDAPRGFSWTTGTFSVPAGGVTTDFEVLMFEQAGGDALEVAIVGGHTNTFDGSVIGSEWDLLEDGILGWKLLNITRKPGDFNSDDKVDFADFTILAANFGTGTLFEQGDTNRDGSVDIYDFAEFVPLFQAAAVPAAAAAPVPEPAGFLSLLLLVCLAQPWLRRRRLA